jgi:hypothetical protein
MALHLAGRCKSLGTMSVMASRPSAAFRALASAARSGPAHGGGALRCHTTQRRITAGAPGGREPRKVLVTIFPASPGVWQAGGVLPCARRALHTTPRAAAVDEAPNAAAAAADAAPAAPRVCIVGGGFGGLYTAVKLETLIWPKGKKPRVSRSHTYYFFCRCRVGDAHVPRPRLRAVRPQRSP